MLLSMSLISFLFLLPQDIPEGIRKFSLVVKIDPLQERMVGDEEVAVLRCGGKISVMDTPRGTSWNVEEWPLIPPGSSSISWWKGGYSLGRRSSSLFAVTLGGRLGGGMEESRVFLLQGGGEGWEGRV